MGASQPIELHGDWTLKLLDLDGSVIRTVEFENALVAGGGGTLAELLAGERTVGTWRVFLNGDNGPCETGGIAFGCLAHEEAGDSSSLFSGLTSVEPDSGDNADKVVLSGSVTAQRTGTIDSVQTSLYHCPPETATDSCGSGFAVSGITSAVLGSPINVIANQVIAIEVVLSFQ